MTTVEVFRVETKDSHYGPYQVANLTKEQIDILAYMAEAHNGSRNHLTPWADILLEGIEDYEYCAFTSLEQLRQWFNGWDDHLTVADFIVQAYSVPICFVRYGRDQCLFEMNKAVAGNQMTIEQVFS